MRALTITADHRLDLAEVPEPTPAPGEVLVDVVAAGVNRADLLQVRGKYPPPPGASELPGLEVSGHRRDTGEPVVALLAGGGYAEVVAVPEGQLLPVPRGLDLVEAAAVVEVAATVVSNLVLEAGLREGETLLVQGANGGIGSCAVQVGRLLGARVVAVVGSADAAAQVRELGAAETIDRHREDLRERMEQLGGADVILDVVGGPLLADHVRMLRDGGRLVVIGTLAGAHGDLPLGELMRRRARVIGTTLRSRPTEDKQRILTATREVLWEALADGRVRIPVQQVLPLERAAEAHEVLRTGGHLGKVVLDLRR
ncbi:NAD(P)H-quinone oxidoreductase [Brachybacterium sp. EF45031]|uniref:NAD(P)H-quinone oxidoreductase n=1 Tax=Brachybacterium sillae TaxID=2810536 RepID=UPI00217EA298|nr:NAD(P)H-quinone oxidoreductase [Brachybacterium sillae]MCS6712049.1 NAD(P)H-quinone oxidoreductase [Brachybacterium sillae]